MSMSKPENAPEVTPRAAQDEIPEREGAFGYGYGDGLEGRDEAGDEETRRESTSALDHEAELERENRLERDGAVPQQTTTGAVNRDMRAQEAEDESHATTLSTAEPAATMDRDEDLSQDSMSGDAVEARPHGMPMQPAPMDQDEQSAPATPASPTAQSPLTADPGPVLAPETSLDFRERWHGIQAEFIDDPRRAVEKADHLVADVARAFASGVEERRRSLTSGWEDDGHGETEELRLAMRQYRALVDHILQD